MSSLDLAASMLAAYVNAVMLTFLYRSAVVDGFPKSFSQAAGRLWPAIVSLAVGVVAGNIVGLLKASFMTDIPDGAPRAAAGIGALLGGLWLQARLRRTYGASGGTTAMIAALWVGQVVLLVFMLSLPDPP
ncbi:MAG: hypothetical protein MUE98_09775 [Rhodobacteraceae bacterium]|jgi:hypothetical protein|nr:hypothetical protein [Paracoccaceae bacterium]